MGAGERENAQFACRAPGGVKPAGFRPASHVAQEHFDREVVLGDAVADTPHEFKAGGRGPEQLARHGRRVGRGGGLRVREFPQGGIDAARRTLLDKEPAVADDDKCQHAPALAGSAPGHPGEVVDLVQAPGDALGLQRTASASGLVRGANRGAQFHERLVQVRAFRRRLHECLGELPEALARGRFPGVTAQAKPSRQQTHNVAVEDGRGLVESDAANGPGGIASDAW